MIFVECSIHIIDTFCMAILMCVAEYGAMVHLLIIHTVITAGICKIQILLVTVVLNYLIIAVETVVADVPLHLMLYYK